CATAHLLRRRSGTSGAPGGGSQALGYALHAEAVSRQGAVLRISTRALRAGFDLRSADRAVSHRRSLRRRRNPEPFSFASTSRRFAHANSMARIASPAGITMKAGPGRIIIATPTSSTVNPATAMATRLIHL